MAEPLLNMLCMLCGNKNILHKCKSFFCEGYTIAFQENIASNPAHQNPKPSVSQLRRVPAHILQSSLTFESCYAAFTATFSWNIISSQKADRSRRPPPPHAACPGLLSSALENPISRFQPLNQKKLDAVTEWWYTQ